MKDMTLDQFTEGDHACDTDGFLAALGLDSMHDIYEVLLNSKDDKESLSWVLWLLSWDEQRLCKAKQELIRLLAAESTPRLKPLCLKMLNSVDDKGECPDTLVSQVELEFFKRLHDTPATIRKAIEYNITYTLAEVAAGGFNVLAESLPVCRVLQKKFLNRRGRTPYFFIEQEASGYKYKRIREAALRDIRKVLRSIGNPFEKEKK